MIIAYDIPGQLGNQLWAYSNLISIARSIESKVVIILQQDYYVQLNEASILAARKANVFICNGARLRSRLIKRGISFCTAANKAGMRKLFRVLAGIMIVENPSDSSLQEMKKRKGKIFLVNAWNHRTEQNAFPESANFIRNMILPDANSKDKAEKYINQLHTQYQPVIAVHIRRGDYANFYGGKYFFDDKVYKEKIEQVANLFTDQKPVFAIFSNEKIDLSNYDGLPVSFNNENTPIGDMWAISKCDFIIGPLSTFSMWASFWNQVPLLFIDKHTAIKSLDQFRPFVSQDKQEEEYDKTFLH